METEILVISEFDEYRSELALMAERSDFVPDTSTEEGYQKSKREALDIAKVRIALDKARKEKKDFFWQGGKAVDAQAKEILEKILKYETPHLNAYKKIDNERKAIQESRLEEIQHMIRAGSTARLEGWDSAKIIICTDELLRKSFDSYDEQKDNAISARDKGVESLKLLWFEVLKKETDAVELEKFKAEAKAKVEYEEKMKAEARKEAEAAQVKAEAAEKEAEKARKLAVKNAEKAREYLLESEKEAARAKKEAAKQAEIDKAEAGRLARELEAKRQDAERLKLIDEADKREANKAHNKKINNEVNNALIEYAFVNEDAAKEVIKAIVQGYIPHVKLSY